MSVESLAGRIYALPSVSRCAQYFDASPEPAPCSTAPTDPENFALTGSGLLASTKFSLSKRRRVAAGKIYSKARSAPHSAGLAGCAPRRGNELADFIIDPLLPLGRQGLTKGRSPRARGNRTCAIELIWSVRLAWHIDVHSFTIRVDLYVVLEREKERSPATVCACWPGSAIGGALIAETGVYELANDLDLSLRDALRYIVTKTLNDS